MLSYINIGGHYIVSLNGETYNVTQSHHFYKTVVAALKSDDEKVLTDLINVARYINDRTAGMFAIEGDILYLGIHPLPTEVSSHIIQLLDSDVDVTCVGFMCRMPTVKNIDDLCEYIRINFDNSEVKIVEESDE